MEAGVKSDSLSTFVVTPNCSMSWQENKILVASLAIVCFGIAGAFAMRGLWVILPFAGLEIMMLAGILYWSSLRASRCEVISIDADNITVEVGRKNMRQLHSFQRAWTKVELYPPTMPNRQSRLVMRSKGKELEVGACLTDHERNGLAASIKEALLPSVK
ncbi:MAG: DUF2244 domain-containing protein [Gammaproteobacteria bacterium]|nr:DUF2244 domain-containing protein [Gammaproteobacteria bacterium]